MSSSQPDDPDTGPRAPRVACGRRHLAAAGRVRTAEADPELAEDTELDESVELPAIASSGDRS
jgi:hypothetical protein